MELLEVLCYKSINDAWLNVISSSSDMRGYAHFFVKNELHATKPNIQLFLKTLPHADLVLELQENVIFLASFILLLTRNRTNWKTANRIFT